MGDGGVNYRHIRYQVLVSLSMISNATPAASWGSTESMLDVGMVLLVPSAMGRMMAPSVSMGSWRSSYFILLM